MMSKKVLISYTTGLLEELDEVARKEHRTRSELVREATRRYIQQAQAQQAQAVQARGLTTWTR